MKWIVLFVSVAVSGCAASHAQQASMDAKCQSWGAKPGTPEYVQCRSMAEQTAAANRAAVAQEEQAAYANQRNWYGKD